MTAPGTTSSQLTPSLVRTLVPIIVGYVVSVAARHGWHVNDDQASATITAVVSYVYYAVVRIAEVKFNSQFGWLLGLRRQPTYTAAATTATTAGSAAL